MWSSAAPLLDAVKKPSGVMLGTKDIRSLYLWIVGPWGSDCRRCGKLLAYEAIDEDFDCNGVCRRHAAVGRAGPASHRYESADLCPVFGDVSATSAHLFGLDERLLQSEDGIFLGRLRRL